MCELKVRVVQKMGKFVPEVYIGWWESICWLGKMEPFDSLEEARNVALDWQARAEKVVVWEGT